MGVSQNFNFRLSGVPTFDVTVGVGFRPRRLFRVGNVAVKWECPADYVSRS